VTFRSNRFIKLVWVLEKFLGFQSQHQIELRFRLDLKCVNDPSAGSPTETLLRLLLPLSDKVYLTFHTSHEDSRGPEGSPDHSKSVGATGGVYKGQGRNQHKLMTYAY
jgi:hypothetical protein